MDQNTASASNQVRRQQMIALGVIVVLIGCGGWLAWRKLHTPSLDEPLVDVAHNGRFGMNLGAQRFIPAAPVRVDGVRKTGATASSTFDVRSGETLMHAVLDKTGEWKLNFRYQPAKTTPEQRRLLSAKYQTMTLQLTAEQHDALVALPPEPAMEVADDDQAKLKDLWQGYSAADDSGKKSREPELIKTLGEVGAKAEKPSADALEAHLAKIKAILTPAQVEKLTKK